MDLASKNPTGGPNCDARHDATDREAHSARKDGVAASIVKDPLVALKAQPVSASRPPRLEMDVGDERSPSDNDLVQIMMLVVGRAAGACSCGAGPPD